MIPGMMGPEQPSDTHARPPDRPLMDLEFYSRYSTGVELIRLLPRDVACWYVSLIPKPNLMIEQMLMNIELDALKEAVLIEPCDALIEEYARKAVGLQTYDQHPLSDSLSQYRQNPYSMGYQDGKYSQANSDTVSEITIISMACSTVASKQSTPNILDQRSDFVMPKTIPNRSDWVPDSKVSLCMVCNVEKFNLFNRKHHCRRCGRVVCSGCSNKFLIMREISSRNPVRVCVDCYDKIVSQEASSNSPTWSNVMMSGKPFMWLMSGGDDQSDQSLNEDVRREFYYECAPSVELCLSLLRLHSNQEQGCRFLIDRICRPMFETLMSSHFDIGLIINIMKSLLTSAKVSLGDRRLGDSTCPASVLDSMLAKIDVMRMLVNNNCRNKAILSMAFSNQSPVRLQEKLLELGRFDLALDLATKFGLDVTAVWKTWAMQCLKNGCLSEARDKFHHCFKRATRRPSMAIEKDNKKTNQAQSKLLGEVLTALLHVDEHQPPLKERIQAIKQGQWTVSMNRDQHQLSGADRQLDIKQPKIFTEAIYYLDMYGTFEDKLKFFVDTKLWGKAIELLIKGNEYSAQNSKIFVHDVFMVASATGSLSTLLRQLHIMDVKKQKTWKYLISVCRYCTRARYFNILYHVQVYMGDHLRAAITQINYFYLKQPVTNYSELNKRLEHLEAARQHCQHYLSASSTDEHHQRSPKTSNNQNANQIASKARMMTMPDKDVARKLKLIITQIEVTKSFARNQVVGYIDNPDLINSINDDDNTKEIGQDDDQDVISNDTRRDYLTTPCTLFDKHNYRKIILAALIACYYDNYFSEGFNMCNQVIVEHDLDKLQVYNTAGRILILNEGSRKVERVSQLIGCIKSNMLDSHQNKQLAVDHHRSSSSMYSQYSSSSLSSAPTTSSSRSTGVNSNHRKANNQTTEKSILQLKREAEDFCDRIIGSCIRFCKDPDHQLSLIKLLSSDELKIDFFIDLGKLSNARLLACKLNRVQDARRVIEAATRLKQDHVKTMCQMWLAQKGSLNQSEPESYFQQ